MTRTLRIPAALAVVVLSGCGSHSPPAATDGKLADTPHCAIDSPPADANGCIVPCGTVATGSPLCHGVETCIDPCGHCPPGCEPLV